MTYLQIIEAFEIEINQINDTISKPATDDSLYWINQAVGKFVKLRFNGDPIHKTGFEQTEKRRDDLQSLVVSVNLPVGLRTERTTYQFYNITYPSDFLYALNEDVVITDLKGGHPMDTYVFECTQDSFMNRINNSLTDFHYRSHRARPIRTRTADGCILYTDKKYLIKTYTLGYLKKPAEITLDFEKPEDAFKQYPDFEDYQLHEIIKMAAQMYLENQKSERYQTISNEVLTQE